MSVAVTVAERDELLDALEHLERILEKPRPGPALFDATAVLVALADLVARALRIWLVGLRPRDDGPA